MPTNNAINNETLVTVFTSSGTWTKNLRTTLVSVWCCGGAGGGGSGRRGASGSGRAGGGGGACRCIKMSNLDADVFSSSESVTIGAGGGGGAAQTVNDSTGNAGTVGGESDLASLIISGNLNISGGGGNTVTGGGGGARFLYESIRDYGFTFSANVSTPSTIVNQFLFPGGLNGGYGGSITSGNASNAGSDAPDNIDLDNNIIITGPTGGTVNSAGLNGNNNIIFSTFPTVLGGTGGSGGGAGDASNPGGDGGDGGSPAGGGGGGGASYNGQNSGAGGDGEDGFIVIIEYFR